MKKLPLFLAALTLTSSAYSQVEDDGREVVALNTPSDLAPHIEAPAEPSVCPEGKVCIPEDDMAAIVQVLQERQCLLQTPPEFDVGSVTIVVDEGGRVFYTGDGPESPYTLGMTWCHFKVRAEGKVKVLAAIKEPPVFGFRFRPKAYMGYALLTPFFDNNSFDSGIDAGIMLDFLHYKYVNLNAAVGFRTFGAGVGVDITQNFGLYAGYGMSWAAVLDPRRQPLHNLVLGVDFAF